MDLSGYSFRPMTAEDLPMLGRWVNTPDARRWWAERPEAEIEELADGLEDPRVLMHIISWRGRPFAYLQDYSPHDWQGHHFAFLPPGARGIDQFIGEPDMLGRGHGSAFVRAYVGHLFAQGAPAVGVDPEPDNARAIRAYEKAGFVRGEVRQTQWHRALLMTRYRQ